MTNKERAEKWAESHMPLNGDDEMYDAVGVAIYEAFLAGDRSGYKRGKKDCPIMQKLDKGILEQKLIDELKGKECSDKECICECGDHTTNKDGVCDTCKLLAELDKEKVTK